MIQPKFGAITCAELQKSEFKLRVEGVFNGLDAVKKPISISANAFLISVSSKAGETSAKARVVFTLVYLSEDGYKKATCEVDGACDMALENAEISVFVTDVKLTTSNGYVAVCTLKFVGESRSLNSVDVLTGGEGLCALTREHSADIYYNDKQGQQVISDEFALDFTVGEVLSYSACAYLTSVSASLGKVIFEGDAVLTVKALPFSENNDIVKEKRVIPFRFELDHDDAMIDAKAYGSVKVGATNVKVFADEGKEKSSVSADITLDFSGGVVLTEIISILDDAYSKTNECKVKRASADTLIYCGQRCFTEKAICQGGSAVENGRLLTVFGEELSVISSKVDGGALAIDCLVKSDVVFKNADNGIVAVAIECPLYLEFNINGAISSLNVVLTDVVPRVRNGEIELECHVKVYFREYEKQAVSYVEEVVELGERHNLDGAICVCLAKKGDSIWDVAKNLGSDEEEIVRFNPETEFPLSQNERIIVYRQKF